MTANLRNVGLRFILVVAVFATMEVAVRVFEVPTFIFPAPTTIFVALYRGISTGLYIHHLWITLAETFLGFVLATALAFSLGISVALDARIEFFFYPFIVMFQAMPKVALAPIMMIWFGLGITSKVVSSALIAFFPLMVNIIGGLRSVEEDHINLMRSLVATRKQIFWMLLFPQALPQIFAGLEVAMLFALVGTIVAEFIGAQAGLGMLMQSMSFTMDVAGQFSVLLVLAVLGIALNKLLAMVRQRVVFWEDSQKTVFADTVVSGGEEQ
jgi:NitT/TauT family transport system permease protein